MRTFHQAPSIVQTSDCARRLKVDFLEIVLPDIRDEHVARDAVETESPRIAQAERPDLVVEWIRRRNGVGLRADIDPQDFSEEYGEVLGVAEGIADETAISDADVEKAIGPELKLTAVVLAGTGMRNSQHDRGGVRIGKIGIIRD